MVKIRSEATLPQLTPEQVGIYLIVLIMAYLIWMGYEGGDK